jgi:hypothetical protein
MPKITALPTDTAPEGADLIPFVDTTAARTEAVTIANLAASAPFNATATTAELNSIASTVNTVGKVTGKHVFNTATNVSVWAVGSTAGSVWVGATGTTVNTPV